MARDISNANDSPGRGAAAPFGRVRLWFDESPPALAASLVLAMAAIGLGWLLAIQIPSGSMRHATVALQPVLDERGLLGVRSATNGAVEYPADLGDLAAAELPPSNGTPDLTLAAADTLRPDNPPSAESATASGNLADSDDPKEPAWDTRTMGEPNGQESEAHDAKPPAAQSNSSGNGIKALAKAGRRPPSLAPDNAAGMPEKAVGMLTVDDTPDTTSRFFGLGAEDTRSVVYVIDCSGSMGRPYFKLKMAKQELIRSIQALQPDQTFSVILFSDRMFPMPGAGLVPATDANKERAREWIDDGLSHGGTNPLPAVLYGLQMQPETMFVLSDGLFKAEYLREIRSHNRGAHRATIYTIGFGDHSGEYQLQRLAHENAGSYRYVEPVAR